MSKKTRGFKPPSESPEPDTGGEQARPDAGASQAPRPSRGADPGRAESRRRAGTGKVESGSGGLERYRSVLIVGALVMGLGVAAIVLLQSTGPAYACDSLLTPGPSEPAPAAGPVVDDSPAPEPTRRLGFTTLDMGTSHSTANSTVRYAFCPPTSGSHWNIAGRAPLPRNFYSPEDSVSPGEWVHNLEHGYVMIAYRGEPERSVLDEIRDAFAEAPPSEVAVQCGLPNKVLALRFDDMAEPFALLAWDRALLMSTFDGEGALTFAAQWQDSPQSPERAC